MNRFNHQLSYRGDASVLVGHDNHIKENPDGTWTVQVYYEGDIPFIREQLERQGFTIEDQASTPTFYFDRYQAGMRFRVTVPIHMVLKDLRVSPREIVEAKPFQEKEMILIHPPEGTNPTDPWLIFEDTQIGAPLSTWFSWEAHGVRFELITEEKED
jgi:hypothetical protein